MFAEEIAVNEHRVVHRVEPLPALLEPASNLPRDVAVPDSAEVRGPAVDESREGIAPRLVGGVGKDAFAAGVGASQQSGRVEPRLGFDVESGEAPGHRPHPALAHLGGVLDPVVPAGDEVVVADCEDATLQTGVALGGRRDLADRAVALEDEFAGDVGPNPVEFAAEFVVGRVRFDGVADGEFGHWESVGAMPSLRLGEDAREDSRRPEKATVESGRRGRPLFERGAAPF